MVTQIRLNSASGVTTLADRGIQFAAVVGTAICRTSIGMLGGMPDSSGAAEIRPAPGF